MAKVIRFTYKDKDYTLEYTRRTVKEMEREGFIARELDAKPMTLLPQLFAGAFKAHHRFTKQTEIDEIYDLMPNKDELVSKLADMYNEPIESLMTDPDGKEGNVQWETNW